MGEVIAINPMRQVPITRRIARPTSRDQQPLNARFADWTPAKLGTVIRQTESGLITDWADLCDRMVVDGEVKASYESRIAAVSASRRNIEPGRCGDPARDRFAPDAASFVEQVLDDVPGFDDSAHDLLDGIGKGLAVQEIDWQFLSGTWIPAHLWWIHTRRFRFSKEWEPMLVDDGESLHPLGLALEPGKFIVHTPRTIAGYPTQTGVMRSVAWPYLLKKWCQQFWLSGAERFAWPFMWATVARDTPIEVREKLLSDMQGLSSDHVAILEDATAVKLMESTVKDGGTWKEFVGNCNGEIGKGVLGMTDATSPGKVGAYGAVESRRGTTVLPRIALDERQLATTIRRDLVTPLLWNNRHRWGGVVPPAPHVRWAVESRTPEVSTDQLMKIVERVETGATSAETAIEAIAIVCPTIDPAKARSLCESAERTWKTKVAAMIKPEPAPSSKPTAPTEPPQEPAAPPASE